MFLAESYSTQFW